MSRRQDGQALVGALVVTTLAFLLAGTVAVGASALLSQETNSHNASSRDLAAQDALAAAVAGVAGKGSAGGSAPCDRAGLLNSTVLSSGYATQAQCVRVDGVNAGPLTLVQLPWSAGCAVVEVSGYSSSHLLIWFTARGNTNAWVDGNSSGCNRQRGAICSDNGSAFVTHGLDCDFTEIQEGNDGDQYLHVQNPAQSPVRIRLAPYNNAGGSIYVLAATTGVPGGPTYEVADLWVSPDGATTALRLEGTL
jgi:hypothetical protein